LKLLSHAAGSAIRALGNPDDPAAAFASDFLSSFIPAPQPLNPLDPNTAPAEPSADPLGEFIAQNQEAWDQRAADQQVAQTAGGVSGVGGADNSIAAPGADGNVSIQDTGAPESADPLGEFIAQNQEAWDQRYENRQQIVDEFTQAGDRPVADGVNVAGPGLGYDPYTLDLIDREQQRVQSLKTGAGVLVDKEALRYFDDLAEMAHNPSTPNGSVMGTFNTGVEQIGERIMAGGYSSYDQPLPAAQQGKVLQLQPLSVGEMEAVNATLGRYYDAYDSKDSNLGRMLMTTPQVLSFAKAYGQLNENQRGYVLANIANNAVQSSEYMDYYRASGYKLDADKPLGEVSTDPILIRAAGSAAASLARLGIEGLAASGARLAGVGVRGVGAKGGTTAAETVTSGGTANAAAGAGLKLDLKTTQAANEVVDSLRSTGQLPSNYVTKAEALQNGWQPGKALNNTTPGGQIGGDIFQNLPSSLPSQAGRVWYEADIGLSNTMSRSNQPGTRLLYSNDGLLYITTDHYKTVTSIGTWK
jgi:hypothetical protein